MDERVTHRRRGARAPQSQPGRTASLCRGTGQVVGERGSDAVAGNVNGALATMVDNIDAVRQGIADLVAASVR